MREIYLDNAATTRPLASLAELFQRHMQTDWYNPSAMYPNAVRMEAEINRAKKVLLDVVRGEQLFFTSGGTESANTVLFGGYRKLGGKRQHFITSEYEHPCVYEAMKTLEGQGHSVTYVRPGKSGRIEPETLTSLVREDTALVSIMHVNNETGAVNDIVELARRVKQANPQTLFHADGVQGFVKCPFFIGGSQVDYYSASAHKLHGIKGTGVLFYKKGAPLAPYLVGGGQQMGMRSGTENTFGIMAFAHVVQEYAKAQKQIETHMRALRERLLSNLAQIEGMQVLSPEDGAPYILNVSFPGMRGEVLLHVLEQQGISIGTGSACSSKKGRMSRTHQALGICPEIAEGAVRISFCKDNTLEEMDIAAEEIKGALKKYRGLIRR